MNQPEPILDRAARCTGLPTLADCTESSLRALSDREGIDFATALLYDRVRRAPAQGPHIDRIESLTNSAGAVSMDATVVIVPGAFWRQYPGSGADGRLIREQAEGMGCRVETIPLPNFSSLAHNARLVRDWLSARRNGEPIVLVSLSKGGGDVKLALASPDADDVFRHVVAWINLSGILDGTPLVSWLFARSWRSAWVRTLLHLRGYDLGIIRDLDRRPGSPLDFPLRLPSHLRAVHVVGFPLVQHATNRLARKCHARLRPHGPNDGAGILLADAVRWPGILYPLWGADHYLRPAGRDIGRVAAGVLRYVGRDLHAEALA